MYERDSWVERFNEWFTELLMKYFIIGMLVVIAGIIVLVCLFGGGSSVCQHNPHFGRCKVQVSEMIYNAATKTMMPSTRECGCISDHAVVVIEKSDSK